MPEAREARPAGTSGPEEGSRLDAIPPRLLPILYFGLAHLLLAAAFGAVALDPEGVAGFFYQPRTIAIVHLVTVGWISASILGALYVIGPMALRTPMPARRSDYVAFALFAAGAFGMGGHFFFGEYGGVAWSGGLALFGALRVGLRAAPALRRAPIQGAVKTHILLAFVNLAVAGGFGLLLALDKTRPFLLGAPLPRVFAHLHLAAVGWAVMMVVGAGYRMLPMVLPSAMPSGRGLYASALLLEGGALGLFAALLEGGRAAWPFALVAAAGFACFLARVRWMRGHGRRRPAWLVLPDYGVLHALLSLLYAAAAAALGAALAALPGGPLSARAAAVYGTLGILGFLAQMVLGMQVRILPMFAAYHANRSATCDAPPRTPRDMGSRRAEGLVFALWTAGVPLLAGGMFLESAPVLGAAGWILFAAAVAGGANAAAILRHAFGPGRR